MFKKVLNRVWAFDCEWAPDPDAGRALYSLPREMPARQVFAEMWQRNGATDSDPRPYLKTVLCRIVSIVLVERFEDNKGGVTLRLNCLPANPDSSQECEETAILSSFFLGIGNDLPQLVGYNSRAADLKILLQRGLAQGIRAAGYCERPDKPWEGIDYFARESDAIVDLAEIVGGFGKAMPSLNEIATVCKIPGKLDATGDSVAEWWLSGRIRDIVHYNEYDALTTYLLWLRLAHFAGHFTTDEYAVEQGLVRKLIDSRIAAGSNEHLVKYLYAWDKLRAPIPPCDA